MKRRFRRMTCMFFCCMAIVIWALVLLRQRTREDEAPARPPDESMRVWHPEGFSVICPEHWLLRIQRGAPGLLLPEIVLSSPRQSLFWQTTRLPNRPVIDAGFRSFRFQGRNAWMKQSVVPGVALDRPREMRTHIVFQRGNAWYAIVLAIYGDYEEIPRMLWSYLESFLEKVDPGKMRVSRRRLRIDNSVTNDEFEGSVDAQRYCLYGVWSPN